ncbi:FecR family protein [Flavobacterium sp. 3HN19-14]|uniref:FecR family protein n=1 Tax=Flavobacterium sp. 3HN19-14 TaxID=3448133 RepID=UPI003EE11EA9
MKEENELARWLAGEMSEEELQQFRQTPEFATYEKIAAYSATLKAPEFDHKKMYRDVISRPKKVTKVIPMTTWIFRVAAILVIALGLFFGARNFTTSDQLALNGKTTAFTLPDNSEVVLNSGSEIEYKKWNWSNNRQLELNGEAFFKVAKGKTFDVNTALGKVTVVGTQFTVKNRNDRFEVECFEGKVCVSSKDGKLFRMLEKGQIVVFENGKSITATATNGDKPLWMQDGIRIISLPLNDIISEIERDYAIKIDNKLLLSSQKFTGVLPKNDLETAIKILGESYGFTYAFDKKDKIVLTQK